MITLVEYKGRPKMLIIVKLSESEVNGGERRKESGLLGVECPALPPPPAESAAWMIR